MSRIFVTGDTHMGIDIGKLNTANFPEQQNLTKDDYVIVCGDLGLVWSDSKEEKYLRKWLHDKNFTTLFVDGNHENHKMLGEYPVEMWNGGKVSFINDSIIHLKRGQVFDINGTKIFTMGGATSVDKHLRVEWESWWEDEIPTIKEINVALENLDKHDWQVDYVITHTTSRTVMEMMGFHKESNILNSFFAMLEFELKFKRWYFGHFHDDVKFKGNRIMVFNDIVELETSRK